MSSNQPPPSPVAALRNLALDKGLHNEGLEEFEGHFLRQTALVKLDVRSDDNNGSTGIVDSLSEKVLSETTFLTLEHVSQGLQWALVGTDDRSRSSAIVNEGIDGFLEKSLFMIDNRFWSLNLLLRLIILR